MQPGRTVWSRLLGSSRYNNKIMIKTVCYYHIINKIKTTNKPDAAGAHGVDEVVSEHEVHTRVHVGFETEVVAVAVDKALACVSNTLATR